MTRVLEGIVVAVACVAGCGEHRAQPTKKAPAEQVLLDAFDARRARIDALRPDFDKRCKSDALATLVEIVGGTYAWNDAIAEHLDDGDARSLDEEARKRVFTSLRADVYGCLSPSRGEPAHALRIELDRELAKQGPSTALRNLLAGSFEARRLALNTLAWAPTRGLRDDLAVFARADDVLAWQAYLGAIWISEDYNLPAPWRTWIEARRTDPKPAALGELLAVASGQPVKDQEAPSLEVRRAAMQAARMHELESSVEPTSSESVSQQLLALSRDPDPVIRRDAARLLKASRPTERARLEELANDPDATVQLAARIARQES